MNTQQTQAPKPICDQCSRTLEEGALYEDHSPGVWDEKSKTFIRPSGTVKQGRRPMFEPHAQAHSTLPWFTSLDNLAILMGDKNDPEIVAALAMDDVMAIQRLEEVEANAAFIVRACNEYDTLTAQNQELLKAFNDHQQWGDEARAELVKAKAHAQRLADELQNVLKYGSAGNENLIREALAQWEKDKQ